MQVFILIMSFVYFVPAIVLILTPNNYRAYFFSVTILCVLFHQVLFEIYRFEVFCMVALLVLPAIGSKYWAIKCSDDKKMSKFLPFLGLLGPMLALALMP